MTIKQIKQDVQELAMSKHGVQYYHLIELYWNRDELECDVEYVGTQLKSFLLYIHLPYDYDMVCITDKDDKYTKSRWKTIKDVLSNRSKEIRIDSPTRKIVLDVWADKFGGHRIEDTLIFPKKE
jgi:hypothetical protein